MSVAYVVTINITADGQSLPGFPVTKTKTVTEDRGKSSFSRPDAAGTYTDLPVEELAGVGILYVTADQAYTLRFQDQTDEGLPMAASGVCLLIDSGITSGATKKVSLDNSSGSATTVTMIAGGS